MSCFAAVRINGEWKAAWVKACGRNFALTSRTTVQLNGGTRKEKKIIGEEDNERREMYV